MDQNEEAQQLRQIIVVLQAEAAAMQEHAAWLQQAPEGIYGMDRQHLEETVNTYLTSARRKQEVVELCQKRLRAME